MTRHCMLDLETLGNRAGCMILSIGATIFTEKGLDPSPHASFHTFLNLEQQAAMGMTMEPSTVLWWLTQVDAARKAQTDSARVNIYNALCDFASWWSDNSAETVWANGADFDIPILTALYRMHGLTPPWKYNAGRCVRTIMALTGRKLGGFGTTNPLAHDALADAQFQAREVAQAMLWLREQQNNVVPIHGGRT